ncbi:putative signaling protein [Alphaproteobacteria bacterium SO-S41]|nr:putative signaling protein [Alphaproteobacteria bacterium SO-S41]
MLRVLDCLAVEHNHSLVFLAAAICVLSSLAVMRIYFGLKDSGGNVRVAYIGLAALVGGSGIWATHFIAMLAYEPGLKTAYEIEGTLMSFGLAVLFSGLGVWAAASSTGWKGRALGGALFGAGIGTMHYTGMLSFRTEGYVQWDASIVAVSLIMGIAIAAAAFCLAGALRNARHQIVGGLVLTAAICSLHFTGMGAVTIVPVGGVEVATSELSNGAIAFLAGAVALLILLAGAGVIMMGDLTRSSAVERMRRLANAAHEGLLLVRDGKVVDANAAFLSLAECRLSDVIGRDLDEGLLRRHDGNGFLTPHDGQPPIPVEVLERSIEQASRGQAATVVLALRDLRERNAAEARIRYLAEHDNLTGLPNRHALKVKLDAALERAAATGESIAVLCIDLDHFKEANDIHGHLAGDRLLAETARRIVRELKAPSFAARLGGDEFVIVQVGEASLATSGALGGRIVDALSQPVPYEGQHVVAGCSVGIALFPEDGGDVQTLLANADMALYRAKDNGRGTFCFFKREMDETIRDRRGLARDLRQSITDEILEVHYQPQANAADGTICGFEALARWTHPLRGPISPAEFIPLAEESGMIGALGEWVLRRACADAAAWDQPLKLAVNLSPLQLHQRDLVKLVAEVLIETGLPAARLELEVTESALFKDYQRALDTLRQLKAMGVGIAMDDFGTGFSSLSTLQSFPFDKIKIDKSFVENINRDERANVIVRTVLGLGRSLDIPVVAEGVETEEQVAFLRGEACAELQGYAIGRPARVAVMTAYAMDAALPEARAAA